MNYVTRRLLSAIPTLFMVSLILFGLVQLAPGSAASLYAGPDAGPEDLARIEKLLGVDQPPPVQYVKWLRGVLGGEWGISFRYQQPVTEVLRSRMFYTIELMAMALFIALIVAVPFGVISAISKRKWVKHSSSILAMLGISIPTFWLGIMLLLIFSVRLRWLPSGGAATIGMDFNLKDRFLHLIGPAMVLATLYIAGWSRYVRSSMQDVMTQDYIRTARAKGLKEDSVITQHALRNSLLPLVTLIGLQGGSLIGGAMITEVVFAWPGVGRLLAESLTSRDYPVLMAAFMVMAVLTVAGNLLADLTYGWVDPRIKLE
ncbi:MAG: ABC transporter permease [Candidatus Promineifilaceae bacterium]|jgi:peptide/nickel transport system permease protein